VGQVSSALSRRFHRQWIASSLVSPPDDPVPLLSDNHSIYNDRRILIIAAPLLAALRARSPPQRGDFADVPLQ